MEGYRSRFKESTLFKGYSVLEFDRVALRSHYILCKTAKLAGADETVVFAEGVISPLAVGALHAGNQRYTRHPVSFLERCDTLTHLLHSTGKLVAQHIGVEVTGRTVDTGNVRAADSSVFHFDEYLSRLGDRFFDIFIPNILRCVNNARFHVVPP